MEVFNITTDFKTISNFELAQHCKRYAFDCLKRLVSIIRDGSDKEAILAAREVLDRGFGKSSQSIELSGDLKIIPVVNITFSGRQESIEGQAAPILELTDNTPSSAGALVNQNSKTGLLSLPETSSDLKQEAKDCKDSQLQSARSTISDPKK